MAISSPPPNAVPWIAMTTGLGQSSISRSKGWRLRRGCSPLTTLPNSRMSAPAMKVRPAPMITTPATPGSAAAAARQEPMRSGTPGLSALTGGLAIVMTAMPSWRVNETRSLMTASQSTGRHVKVSTRVILVAAYQKREWLSRSRGSLGMPARRPVRSDSLTVSTLTLVRHGQAAPFQQENASLTLTGEAQAEKLAEFWLRNQVCFDEVLCGTLPRQMRTEQLVAARFRAAGQAWPDSQPDGSWNEYDATGVLLNLVPADPRLSALAAEFEQVRSGPDESRR